MSWLLDTVTVSELRRRGRDSGVVEWAAAQELTSLHLSAITMLELERGVLLKERTDGRQGAVLRQWLNGDVVPTFAGRILPLDEVAARITARLHVPAPRPERDAMIAGIAQAHGLTVVTRNVRDFEPLGVRVFNPWRS